MADVLTPFSVAAIGLNRRGSIVSAVVAVAMAVVAVVVAVAAVVGVGLRASNTSPRHVTSVRLGSELVVQPLRPADVAYSCAYADWGDRPRSAVKAAADRIQVVVAA